MDLPLLRGYDNIYPPFWMRVACVPASFLVQFSYNRGIGTAASPAGLEAPRTPKEDHYLEILAVCKSLLVRIDGTAQRLS